MKKVIISHPVPSNSHKYVIIPWIERYRDECVNGQETHESFMEKYLSSPPQPLFWGQWYRFENGVIMRPIDSQSTGFLTGFGFDKINQWYDITNKPLLGLKFSELPQFEVRKLIMNEAVKRGYERGVIVHRIAMGPKDYTVLESGNLFFLDDEWEDTLYYGSPENKIQVFCNGSWARIEKRFGK